MRGSLEYSRGDKNGGKWGGVDVRIDACSVFLQVSSQDEDSFTVLRNGEFLG